MISPLDLPTEVFTKPHVWTRYLLKETPGGLMSQGYSKPRLQTFYDMNGDSILDSRRGLKTYVTYVWYNSQWVKVV